MECLQYIGAMDVQLGNGADKLTVGSICSNTRSAIGTASLSCGANSLAMDMFSMYAPDVRIGTLKLKNLEA
jgi:hypothetical protein